MHKFELQISKQRFQTNELKEKDTAACMQYRYIDLQIIFKFRKFGSCVIVIEKYELIKNTG